MNILRVQEISVRFPSWLVVFVLIIHNFSSHLWSVFLAPLLCRPYQDFLSFSIEASIKKDIVDYDRERCTNPPNPFFQEFLKTVLLLLDHEPPFWTLTPHPLSPRMWFSSEACLLSPITFKTMDLPRTVSPFELFDSFLCETKVPSWTIWHWQSNGNSV